MHTRYSEAEESPTLGFLMLAGKRVKWKQLMPDHPRLIAETPEAVAWIDQVKVVYSGSQVFGKTFGKFSCPSSINGLCVP
jgi:hypothetical protein